MVRTLRPSASAGEVTAHQVVLAHLVEQVLADLAVQHAARLVVVLEQERQVEHIGLRHEVAQRAGGGDHHVHGADLQALDHGALAAEGAGGMFQDLELAVAETLQGLLEGVGTDRVVGAVGEGMAEVDGLGRLGTEGPHGQGGGRDAGDGSDQAAACESGVHCCYLMWH